MNLLGRIITVILVAGAVVALVVLAFVHRAPNDVQQAAASQPAAASAAPKPSSGTLAGGTIPKPAASASPAPKPEATAAGGLTPAQIGAQLPKLLRPEKFDHDTCPPEQTAGCSFDVGVKDGQVGLAFGVGIKWPKGNLDLGNDGCKLVILRQNSWFENLWLHDARWETYDVPLDDYEGWLKNLAVQRAAEQASDYKCPDKDFASIPQWTSNVGSPPQSTGLAGANTATNQARSGASGAAPQASAAATTNGTAKCPPDTGGLTYTKDVGGKDCAFNAHQAVVGYLIMFDNGATRNMCYMDDPPVSGKVRDGGVGNISDRDRAGAQRGACQPLPNQ